MKKLSKVLILGSGPIIIGQAAEFDYSGTQTSISLREEGIKTIILNSNPATIQTDLTVADKVYIQPIDVHSVLSILQKEQPDGLIISAGGQTALNLGLKVWKERILSKYKLKILGTSIQTINIAEDREKFKIKIQELGLPTLPSINTNNVNDAINFAKKIGYPLIVRQSFSLGGNGGITVNNETELIKHFNSNHSQSTKKMFFIEQSVIGWAELEYEVIRDNVGNKIIVCNMENIDPMGVHTGESIVVAPSQTLNDDIHQILRNAAFTIVEKLKIVGACNVQFALNQFTGKYYVIEVNPRLSRSSALASKATGYPIARIAAKLSLGKKLPGLTNPITGKTAFFEPALDYVVVKVPKWPHEKFPMLDKSIGISMKSTGESMGIGRTFEEALYKAIEGLNQKDYWQPLVANEKELKSQLKQPNVDRLKWIFSAFTQKLSVFEIAKLTRINIWFIQKLYQLSKTTKTIEKNINVYKMVDTCAGEFQAITPYFYSTHGSENEATALSGPKVVILGSGPIKIGQGIEFDYMTVHAVETIQKKGLKAIVVNNNPETVSTDYSMSDRLYFEPLTKEFVLKTLENEKNGLSGVICQFGGQTSINLAEDIERDGYKILGTASKSIKVSEDRKECAILLKDLGLLMPEHKVALSKSQVFKHSASLGLPVLLRPSFVIGGEGMIIANYHTDIENYLNRLPSEQFSTPLLIDKFLSNALEIDIDFISDGTTVQCFVSEQIEPAGVHSGDSTSIFPAQNINEEMFNSIVLTTKLIAQKLKIIGLGNIQCAIQEDKLYILEINPRASRTIPFISKCLGISLVEHATNLILGEKLTKIIPHSRSVAIKVPIFSNHKLKGIDTNLGPLMKSTGEVMYVGKTYKDVYNQMNIERKTIRK